MKPGNKMQAQARSVVNKPVLSHPGKAASPQPHHAHHVNRAPVAPAAYRPQPTPRCLQPKAAPTRQPLVDKIKGAPLAPAVHRPQLVMPKVLQSKTNGGPSVVVKSDVGQAHVTAARPGLQRATIQPFTSRVVQAVKYYPNLHPGAVESVEPSSVFRLKSFADQYRLNKVNSHGVNVPNQLYNFVRTQQGEMLLHNRYRHPSIAEGQHVLYAGEIFFNNGKLEWWSNGSGHYQPDVEDAEQANLPMDSFYSYQQIIKGEHKRQAR